MTGVVAADVALDEKHGFTNNSHMHSERPGNKISQM